MEPLKINYSELYIRKAIRSYWWNQGGSPNLFILVPITIIAAYQIATDGFNWIVGVIGLGVFLLLTLMVLTFFEYFKRPLSQLRSMQVPEATLEIEEEQFRITSDAWDLEIEWNSIRDIWHSDKVWILTFSRHKFMILPVAELTQEAKSFIMSRIKSVLYHTGQAWKIRAYYVCLWLSVFLIIGPWLIESIPRQWATYSYITGFIFWVGAVFFRFAIRCLKCRTNWNSQAAKSISKDRYGCWPDWLLTLKKCPFCGATGNDFDRVEDEISLD